MTSEADSQPNNPTPVSSWSNPTFLRQMLSSFPVAIVMVDEAGLIQYANPKLLEMFGYRPNELDGKPIEVLVPGRFAANHVQERNKYVASPHIRPMGAGIELVG